MTNFDELMVETLRVNPAVRGVYREYVGLYVVDVDLKDVQQVAETVRSQVNPNLTFAVGRPVEGQQGVTTLWAREEPAAPPPAELTLNDVVESLRETLLAERNKLILSGEAPESLGGYVIDVADPCCPPKFKALAGGDEYVKHCRATGALSVVSGVMPRSILARHIEPIARKVEKMPESPIFFTDAPVPRLVRTLESWRSPNEMIVLTVFKCAVGLKAVAVPTLVKI